jgi:phosphoserine phosphatase RsbU/P
MMSTFNFVDSAALERTIALDRPEWRHRCEARARLRAVSSLDGSGPDRPSAIAGNRRHAEGARAVPEWLIRELKVAEEVQHRLLPRSLPGIPGYEFFAYYHAAYEVGGDYYDFVAMPEDRLGIALGDVSGKGVAAALIMAKFSGDTRLALQAAGSPSAAAHALNRALCESGIDERYITLNLAVLDPRAGRLQICSAGHPPLLLRRPDGGVERLCRDSGCLPLGILPDAAYQQVEVTLGPGEVAVLYSDGVTDARNASGDLFDTCEHPRLRRVLEQTPGGPVAIGEAVLREVRGFSRGQAQADDLTLLCFGRVGR